jgi:uncharacterized SAM-binding protein YcdF (DUF218 family)
MRPRRARSRPEILATNPNMKLRPPRRWAPILVLVALAAAAIVAVPAVREAILRAAGWALVLNQPIAPSDIIVVSLDSAGAGALEAADLVQSGIATRVAVFADPPSGEDYEFIRRGLPYDDSSATQIRQLRSLGVTDIMQIPRSEDGTKGEGEVFPAWCDQHQFGSVVFVTSRDHSRRMRLVLDRVMKGHTTRVAVEPARYSVFDPDRWWETRDGIRIELIELQKLVLEVVLHPIHCLIAASAALTADRCQARPDDKAGVQFLNGPSRREAAGGHAAFCPQSWGILQ